MRIGPNAAQIGITGLAAAHTPVAFPRYAGEILGTEAEHRVLLGLVLLLVFGPKRLPEMGRSLGKGMREFKDSVTGSDRDPDELPRRVEQAEERKVA